MKSSFLALVAPAVFPILGVLASSLHANEIAYPMGTLQFADYEKDHGDVVLVSDDESFDGFDCGGIDAVCDDGCDCCRGCFDCCQPLWTFRAGAVYIARTSPKECLLLYNVINGSELLNANELKTDWAAGYDLSAIRHFDCSSAIEARFFAVDGWNSQGSLRTSPIWGFNMDPTLFGLSRANIDYNYSTRLYSAELNLRREWTSWCTFLAGFRMVQLHESLGMDADFSIDHAFIETQTNNYLYGFQIGVDAGIWGFGDGPLSVDGILKAGVYGNSARTHFTVTQEIGPAFRSYEDEGQVAFLGEIGLTGVYQLTDRVALRGGYQLIWLSGVAIAPEQIPAINVIEGDGIDAKNSALYHGATAGLEVVW